MPLKSLQTILEQHVFDAPSSPTLFNPYRDRVDSLDLPDAPHIRRCNLIEYVASYAQKPRVLLLAEAPGPRGCRFSGVPFTSEAQLEDPAFPLHGRPSSLAETPYTEYSGSIFWRVARPYWPAFFVWNTVPLHPHKAGAPLSVRNPTRREVQAWGSLLSAMLGVLRPTLTLAVGRKAEYALQRLGHEATYIRHPSQGGARAFENGMSAAFGQTPGTIAAELHEGDG